MAGRVLLEWNGDVEEKGGFMVLRHWSMTKGGCGSDDLRGKDVNRFSNPGLLHSARSSRCSQDPERDVHRFSNPGLLQIF